MISKKYLLLTGVILTVMALVLTGCSTSDPTSGSTEAEAAVNPETEETNEATTEPKAVNVYTDRHYDTDDALYEMFTEETGIEVNIVKAKSDELIERLNREGEDTQADLIVLTDAGRLGRAKDQGLLQPVTSDVLTESVPENLRDEESYWHALTMRARIIAYSLDRVDPATITSYEDLTQPEWEDSVLVRSSTNIYNQSLMASMIAIHGEDYARDWAEGIVNNMARDPKGNDRDQSKAIVAGEGDVAIMNSYYVGKMLNSTDPEEVKVAESIGIIFPNQETTGTHVNITGVGMTAHAKNEAEALALMEFLVGEEAQGQYAEANYEYPINPNVEPSELLKSWGEFDAQDINLTLLGEYNKRAVEIMNEIGWK